MERDSNWTDYFLDFNLSINNCCALKKGIIANWIILRCDSCIQVSAICKAKQALRAHCDMPAVVTEVVILLHSAFAPQGAVFHLASKFPGSVCTLGQLHAVIKYWLVHNWNEVYILKCFPNLAAFLPHVCLAYSGM